MSTTDRVSDLLVRWEMLRDQGNIVPAEDLCHSCPELLAELKSKIAQLQSVGRLMGTTDDQTRTHAPTGANAATAPLPSSAIPGYELLSELGRGGMGVVYKARHLKLNRVVALKMILAGEHAGKKDLERFQVEAEAVARLQHSGIVQIHEVGEHEGRPFFSLEYVAGGSLAGNLHGDPWPAPRAAELVEQLARAMHHAHEHGVVHRDLKPGNVLLAAGGTAKITDFGLAKKLDDASGATQSGAIMGTPSYMAPEQALGRTKAIGPAADVYALGAILYELLTGRPPFKGTTVMETLAQVVADEPVPPSRLSKVPVDVETVCLKCLEKDARQRYGSAAELAAELLRYINGEPILARPITAWQRGVKWARRNPAVTGLLLAVFLTLTAGVGVASFFAVSANEARKAEAKRAEEANQARQIVADQAEETSKALKDAVEARQSEARQAEEERKAKEEMGRALKKAEAAQKAEAERAEGERKAREETNRALEKSRFDQAKAEVVAYSFRLDAARQLIENGNPRDALVQLRVCDPKLCGWEHDYLIRLCQNSLENRGKKLVGSLSLNGHTGIVYSVAISADSKRIVSGSQDGTVKVWNADKGQEVLSLKGHAGVVRSVAFSADDKYIVSGGWDNTVKVWDADTGYEIMTLRGHKGAVWSAAFSSDAKCIVSGSSDKTVKVWDADTGKEVMTLRGHNEPVSSVEFSADSKWIVSGSGDNTVKLWDARTGEETLTLKGHTEAVTSVAFSKDGNRIVSGSHDRTVKLWDLKNGQESLTLWGHTEFVKSVTFSADGKRIISAGGFDMTVKLWDATTGQETLTLKGHNQSLFSVNCVAMSADGKRIISAGGEDRTVSVWDTTTGQESLTLKGHTRVIRSMAITPDGKRIVTASADSTVKLWNTTTGQEELTLKGHMGGVHSVAISADGKRIVSVGGKYSTVKVWDATTGQESLILKGENQSLSSVNCVAISADGRRIVLGNFDKSLTVWDATTGQKTLLLKGHTATITSVAITTDGKRIASGSDDQTVKVWDTTSGQATLTLKGHSDHVYSVAISEDGKRIVSGGYDRTLRIWDATTGQETHTLRGHKGSVLSVAITADGKRIVSGSEDKSLKIWDATTGQEMLTLEGHTERVASVAITSEGTRIVSGSFDQTVKLWDVEALLRVTLGAKIPSKTGDSRDSDNPGNTLKIKLNAHLDSFKRGNALRDQGNWREAEAAYREAIRYKRDFPEAHNNLGNILKAQGKPLEAVSAYREAIRLMPDFHLAHNNLGIVLKEQGKLPEAVAAYREAIRLKSDYPEAHCNLGFVLKLQGELEASRDEFRRGHTLGEKSPGWRHPSDRWVREAERFVELDRRLPDIIDGKSKPANAAEQIEFATLCGLKRVYSAAVRFYADAFQADAALANDLVKMHRYRASCNAAVAAAGKDGEAKPLDEPERTRLRSQTLGWLRSDLAAWSKRLDGGKPADRTLVEGQMRLWQKEADLASVREADAIAKLPETERTDWQKLWQDVEALLKRAVALK